MSRKCNGSVEFCSPKIREEVTGLDLDKRQFASATVLLFGAPDFMIFVVHLHPST